MKTIYNTMFTATRPPNIRRSEIKNLENAIKNKNNIFFGIERPEKKIGSVSANGAIFQMKKLKPNLNNSPRKVLKIVKSPGGAQEYKLQSIAARSGLSPRVYRLVKRVPINSNVANAFFSNKSSGNDRPVNINAFLMNNLAQNNRNKVMNFHNFMENPNISNVNKRKQFIQLKRMVQQLGRERISHGNLHPGNVYVVMRSDGSTKLYIIDFGRSLALPMNTRRTAGEGRVRRMHTVGPMTNNQYGVRVYPKKMRYTGHVVDSSKLDLFRKYYKGPLRKMRRTGLPTKKR